MDQFITPPSPPGPTAALSMTPSAPAALPNLRDLAVQTVARRLGNVASGITGLSVDLPLSQLPLSPLDDYTLKFISSFPSAA